MIAGSKSPFFLNSGKSIFDVTHSIFITFLCQWYQMTWIDLKKIVAIEERSQRLKLNEM